MPPEQPQFEHVWIFWFMIHFRSANIWAQPSQGFEPLGQMCEKSQWLTNVSCPVLWKQAGALWAPLNTAVSLCIGAAPCYCFCLMDCIIIPTLFCCVLTGGTVNMTVWGFMFPGPECHKEKEECCFGQELLRLICNGPPGLFDVGSVQPASQVLMNLTIVAGSQQQMAHFWCSEVSLMLCLSTQCARKCFS